MSLRDILSNLIHGRLEYCCLCFGETDDRLFYLNDEILVHSSTSLTMADLLNTLFGESLDSVHPQQVFCSQCTTSAVNSYKFISMVKKNTNDLILALDSIQESLDNTLPEPEIYKTMYVSIDMDDFTSKQYYDNGITGNPLKAYKRFVKIVNPTFKEEKTPLKTTIDMKSKIKKVNHKNGNKKFDIPSFDTKDMLAKVDNDINTLQCKHCYKIFHNEKKLRWHFFKIHHSLSTEALKCTKCGRYFSTKEKLYEHESNAHTVGFCGKCGKHFANRSFLKKHEMYHDFQITCSECGRIYRSKEAYRKHISDDVCRQKTKKSAEQAVYECDHCQKRYCYKPYLAKHIMYEHGNKEGFRCTFCNKNFYTHSRLKTHMVKHTKEKNYLCTICKKCFVTRESLVYHTRIHTGEKPYACDYCSQSFLNASRRLNHVRKYHLPPSLECETCHTKFNLSSELLKHKKSHLSL